MREASIPRTIARENSFDRLTMAAYRAAVRRYARLPWVSGVTIGMRERRRRVVATERAVIAIHVHEKLPLSELPKSRRIPRTILGVETDVVQATYKPAGGGGAAIAAIGGVLTMHPGASIARANGSAASMGAHVRDEAGIHCLLCAAHTLREGGSFKKGDLIVHPGPAEAAGGALTTIATFQQTHLGLDAGIARFVPNVIADNVAMASGVQIGAPHAPVLGRIVEKSGRGTGLTQAVIKSVGTIGGLHPAIELLPVSGSNSLTPISDRGDSGAVWYDAETFEAVGLHSAGSGAGANGNQRAIASWVVAVLQKMKLTWV